MQDGDSFGDGGVQIDGRQTDGGAAGESSNRLVGRAPSRLFAGSDEVAVAVAGGQRFLHEGEISEHGGEQIVEIVGDAARQLANRLELACLPQMLFELPLLRDIAANADQPGESAAWPPKRCVMGFEQDPPAVGILTPLFGTLQGTRLEHGAFGRGSHGREFRTKQIAIGRADYFGFGPPRVLLERGVRAAQVHARRILDEHWVGQRID